MGAKTEAAVRQLSGRKLGDFNSIHLDTYRVKWKLRKVLRISNVGIMELEVAFRHLIPFADLALSNYSSPTPFLQVTVH